MAKNPEQRVSNPERAPLERRAARRYGAWAPAYLELPSDGIKRLCVTHDMSRVGGMLMTHVNLDPGEPVRVELFLGTDTNHPRVARAHVVRSKRREQRNTFWTFDTALKFDEPIDDTVGVIEELSQKQRDWWPNE